MPAADFVNPAECVRSSLNTMESLLPDVHCHSNRIAFSSFFTINEIRTILERDDLKRQRLLKGYSTKVEKESGSSFLSDILCFRFLIESFYRNEALCRACYRLFIQCVDFSIL